MLYNCIKCWCLVQQDVSSEQSWFMISWIAFFGCMRAAACFSRPATPIEPNNAHTSWTKKGQRSHHSQQVASFLLIVYMFHLAKCMEDGRRNALTWSQLWRGKDVEACIQESGEEQLCLCNTGGGVFSASDSKRQSHMQCSIRRLARIWCTRSSSQHRL